jgi:predicted DNA-binding transcriptional regulator AlpA
MVSAGNPNSGVAGFFICPPRKTEARQMKAKHTTEIPAALADDRVLDMNECAALVGRRTDWLRQQIKIGKGPPVVRFGARSSGVRIRDLRRWMDSCVEPAPERGAMP